MQQLNYNYIIVDVKSSANLGIVERALTFSNRNYILISQEISSIGYCKQFFDSLNKKGLDFTYKANGNKSVNDKNNFIVNRYSPKLDLNERAIKDWFETKSVWVVPDNSEEINHLSFRALPIVSNARNRYWKECISDIASDIEGL